MSEWIKDVRPAGKVSPTLSTTHLTYVWDTAAAAGRQVLWKQTVKCDTLLDGHLFTDQATGVKRSRLVGLTFATFFPPGKIGHLVSLFE